MEVSFLAEVYDCIISEKKTSPYWKYSLCQMLLHIIKNKKWKSICIEVSTCTAVQSISIQVDEFHKLNSLWSTPRSRNRTRATFEVPSCTYFQPPPLPLGRVATNPDSQPVDQLLPGFALYVNGNVHYALAFVSTLYFMRCIYVVCSCPSFIVLSLELLYCEM